MFHFSYEVSSHHIVFLRICEKSIFKCKLKRVIVIWNFIPGSINLSSFKLSSSFDIYSTFFVLYDLNLSYLKWPSISCILRWYLDLIRIIVSCFSFYGKLQYTLATNDEGTNRLMIYNFERILTKKKFKSPVPSYSDWISFTFVV